MISSKILARLKQLREARKRQERERNGMMITPSSEELELLQQVLGRPLTLREKTWGEVERRDDRDPRTKVEQQNRPLVKAKTDEGPLSDELARAERRAAESRTMAELRNMTAEERWAHTLRESNKSLVEKEQQRAAEAAHAEKIQPLIAKLDALRDRMAIDPEFTFADVSELELAYRQVQTVGACPVAAQRAVDTCLARARSIDEARHTQARTTLDEARADIDVLAELLGLNKTAQQPTPKSHVHDPEWLELYDAMDALRPGDPGLRPILDRMTAIESQYAPQTD